MPSLKCPICEFVTPHRDDMGRHILELHVGPVQTPKVKLEDDFVRRKKVLVEIDVFQCNHCHFESEDEFQLREHLKNKHSSLTEQSENKSNDEMYQTDDDETMEILRDREPYTRHVNSLKLRLDPNLTSSDDSNPLFHFIDAMEVDSSELSSQESGPSMELTISTEDSCAVSSLDGNSYRLSREEIGNGSATSNSVDQQSTNDPSCSCYCREMSSDLSCQTSLESCHCSSSNRSSNPSSFESSSDHTRQEATDNFQSLVDQIRSDKSSSDLITTGSGSPSQNSVNSEASLDVSSYSSTQYASSGNSSSDIVSCKSSAAHCDTISDSTTDEGSKNTSMELESAVVSGVKKEVSFSNESSYIEESYLEHEDFTSLEGLPKLRQRAHDGTLNFSAIPKVFKNQMNLSSSFEVTTNRVMESTPLVQGRKLTLAQRNLGTIKEEYSTEAEDHDQFCNRSFDHSAPKRVKHEEYSCDECDFKSKSKKRVNMHYKNEHVSNPNVCSSCNKGFATKASLKSHQKTYSDESGRPNCYEKGMPDFESKPLISCSLCDYQTFHFSNYTRHTNIVHYGRKRHFCHVCNKRFGEKKGLQVHFERKHKVPLVSTKKSYSESDTTLPTITCTDCSSTFSDDSSLKEHITINSNHSEILKCANFYKVVPDESEIFHHSIEEGNFSCLHCTFESDDRTYITNHVRSSHKVSKYVCKKCFAEYFSIGKMRNHLTNCNSDILMIEHISDFESTGSSLSLQSDLDITESVDGESSSIEIGLSGQTKSSSSSFFSSTNDTSCSCQYCSKTFKDTASLLRHIEKSKITNSDLSFTMECSLFVEKPMDDSELLIYADSQNGSFTCLQCCSSHQSLEDASRHITEEHSNTSIYECKNCHQEFINQSEASSHCSQCDKSEVESSEKSNHSCSQCGFSTKFESFFLKHLKIVHSMTKRGRKRGYESDVEQKCPLCPYTSKYSQCMNRHRRAVHEKERDYICLGCFTTFSHIKVLRRHIESSKLDAEDPYHDFRCAQYTKINCDPKERLFEDTKRGLIVCKLCRLDVQTKEEGLAHVVDRHRQFTTRYRCRNCGTGYDFKKEMIDHCLTCVDTSNYIPATGGKYICNECDFKTDQKSEFADHVTNVHYITQNPLCVDCGLFFVSSENFDLHLSHKHTIFQDIDADISSKD